MDADKAIYRWVLIAVQVVVISRLHFHAVDGDLRGVIAFDSVTGRGSTITLVPPRETPEDLMP
jgi:hypothetical protein